MQHPTHRLIHIVALLSIAALCLGQSCNSPNTGGPGGTAGSGGAGGTGGSGGVGTEPGTPIAGTYIERYNCRLADGTCVGEDVRIEIAVTYLGNNRYDIDDLSSNAGGVGVRTGDVVDWDSTDPDFPGFSETGTWVFTFAPGSTTFIKTSGFMQDQGMRGECNGTGRLKSDGVDPDPPPALPCTPQ